MAFNMKRASTFMLIVVFSLSCTYGFKIYQHGIPNGENIPHPCKTNYIWEGVGHQSPLGGGERNPFGLDFKAAKVWTEALCRADSDGDGKTNGEELGDPDCVWSKGAAPNTTEGLSHPGVCEPTNSTDCIAKNSWEIDCSEGADLKCEGVDHPDTINITLKFDRTKVPSDETTYICQSFKIPDDKEYHLIATKPFISNQYVMHHTLVYGCPGGVEGFETPTKCGMKKEECSKLIGGWTLGANGDCELPDTGIRVGKGAFSTVLIEHHWNNPTNEVNYYDESGMTLYLTPHLRPNNIGSLVTGQYHLEIPPRTAQYTASAVCKNSCVSKKLRKSSIYITSAHLHMHYLGSAGSIEQWRNGELVKQWFFEEKYSYDFPVFNLFNPPLELKPEDEIRTLCHFNSLEKNETTYQGEATSDEMCYGFMSYYPAEIDFNNCVSVKERDFCEFEDSYYKKRNKVTSASSYSCASCIKAQLCIIFSILSCVLRLQ